MSKEIESTFEAEVISARTPGVLFSQTYDVVDLETGEEKSYLFCHYSKAVDGKNMPFEEGDVIKVSVDQRGNDVDMAFLRRRNLNND